MAVLRRCQRELIDCVDEDGWIVLWVGSDGRSRGQWFAEWSDAQDAFVELAKTRPVLADGGPTVLRQR